MLTGQKGPDNFDKIFQEKLVSENIWREHVD